MNYIFDVIIGNKLQTQLMQCADVFEPSKVLGQSYSITIESGQTDINILIDNLRKSLETMGLICSFIYLDDNNVWWCKSVRTISSGSKWFILDDYIRRNYPKLIVETDNRRFITSIKRNPEIF